MAEKFDLSVILRFIDKSGPGLKKFKNQMKSVGRSISDIGAKATAAVTLPLVALGGFALKSAIDMESAFTGVKKTVNGTAEELIALREQIKGLSLKIPIKTTELFAVAEAAGQLGIETKNIVTFTKVMADLGATTNLSSTEAASALAKFANITGLSQDKFDRLGSTIVDLGNKTATTEKDIVAMALRLAGAGKVVGLTDAQILAFAASLSSVGIEAEAGGSAFSQVFKRIDKEVDTGSKKMDRFALVAGKSTKDFEKAWKKDAAGAILEFVKGLDTAQKAGINVNQILDGLGLEGIRISDSLLRASGANEKFNKNQDIAKTAWEENIALQKEAELRYKTTASQLVLFKNDLNLLSNEFGKVMLPVLRDILKELKPFIDQLKELSPEMKENILKIAGIFLVGGPFLLGIGKAAGLFAALASPVTALAIGFAAIAFAIDGIIENWDIIKDAFSSFPKIAATFGFGDISILKGVKEGKGVRPKRVAELIKKREERKTAPAADLSKLGGMASFAAGFMPKQQSEITIKLESAPDTSAVVIGVKGDGNVKVENKSSVGNTLTAIADVLAMDI